MRLNCRATGTLTTDCFLSRYCVFPTEDRSGMSESFFGFDTSLPRQRGERPKPLARKSMQSTALRSPPGLTPPPGFGFPSPRTPSDRNSSVHTPEHRYHENSVDQLNDETFGVKQKDIMSTLIGGLIVRCGV